MFWFNLTYKKLKIYQYFANSVFAARSSFDKMVMFHFQTCHTRVGTDVISVKAAKLLGHLGDVLPEKKNGLVN